MHGLKWPINCTRTRTDGAKDSSTCAETLLEYGASVNAQDGVLRAL